MNLVYNLRVWLLLEPTLKSRRTWHSKHRLPFLLPTCHPRGLGQVRRGVGHAACSLHGGAAAARTFFSPAQQTLPRPTSRGPEPPHSRRMPRKPEADAHCQNPDSDPGRAPRRRRTTPDDPRRPETTRARARRAAAASRARASRRAAPAGPSSARSAGTFGVGGEQRPVRATERRPRAADTRRPVEAPA